MGAAAALILVLPPTALASPPANDNFSAAQLLRGDAGTVPAATIGATTEPFETVEWWDPPCCTVWYRWVAPRTATYEFAADYGSGFPRIRVYQGPTLGALTAVARQGPVAYVPAVAGNEYSISVDSALVWALRWRPHGPANDAFEAAERLVGSRGSVAGTTDGATAQAGEPTHAGARWSTWYEWTAPSDGALMIDTAGSEFDTRLAVYEGNALGSLDRLAANDDARADGTSGLRIGVYRGRTYRIAVAGDFTSWQSRESSGPSRLNWKVVLPPPGDAFARPQSLAGASGSLVSTNAGATKEAGEPNHGGVPAAASVWLTWTAPTSGPVRFDTLGPRAFDTQLAVYVGDRVDALSVVTASDDYAPYYGDGSLATFTAVAGRTYAIAVDGLSVGSGGSSRELENGTFTLRWGPRPANDDFASATTLTGVSGSVAGTTVDATFEFGSGEEAHNGVESGTGGTSVWYRWVAPTDGEAIVDISGASWSIVLAGYRGSTLDDLEPVRPPILGYYGATSLKWPVRAGIQYWLAVDGNYVGAHGPFTLNWRISAPENDAFGRAKWFRFAQEPWEEDTPLEGSTGGATREPGEPEHGGVPTGGSVWFTFTLDHVRHVQLETTGSDFDTVLALYKGTSLATLTPVTSNDDSGPERTSRIATEVGPGTYFVALAGKGSAVGSYRLLRTSGDPRSLVPPENDDFASATPVTGFASGRTTSATREPGEPYEHGYGPSVWYRWTAPSTGAFDVRLGGTEAGISASYAVYAGDHLDALDALSGTEGDGELVRFSAVAGREYHIGIAPAEPAALFDMWISPADPVPPPNDDFGNAVSVGGWEGTAPPVDTDYATRQEGEPHNHYERSVWYRWVAPDEGVLRFTKRTDGGFHEGTWLYSGTRLDNLRLIDYTTASVRRGEVVYVAIDSWSPYFRPPVTPTWTQRENGPPNDRFEQASVLGAHGTVYGSAVKATRQSGEPAAAARSIWFRWTAPAGGRATFDVRGSDIDTNVAVFTGTAVDGLTPVPGTQSAEGLIRFTATPATTYSVAVSHPEFEEPPDSASRIRLDWGLQPANDLWAAAQPLAGPQGSATGRSQGAAKEVGEPAHSGNSGGASVWYRWTAPADGSLLLDTRGSGFDALLGIYTGESVDRLQRVDADDQTGQANQARVAVDVAAGSTYSIAVDGFWGDVGSVRLSWRYGPENDAFATAETLDPDRYGRVSGTTWGSSREAGEPNHAGHPGQGSVWYRWTPAVSGRVTLDTVGTSFDTLLAVYTGNAVDRLTAVASNDDADGIVSATTFRARAGTTYNIAVDGRGRGRLFLSWNQMAAPAHDDFADAHVLDARSGTLEDSNLGATAETGEGQHAAVPLGGSSVWYRWTAPADGVASLEVGSSTVEAAVAVYTGDSLATLTEVASSRTAPPLPHPPEVAYLTFEARHGVTYRIAVDTDDGNYGSFGLSWNRDVADAFPSWTNTQGAAGRVAGTTVWAGREAEEPVHGPGGTASVWLAWKAPIAANVVFDTVGSALDTVLAVYSGHSINGLQRLAADDDSAGGGLSRVRLAVGRGAELKIAVDGKNGARGPYVLNWHMEIARPPNDDFAAATVLTEPYPGASYGYTNHSATHEPAEPNHVDGGRRSVWFRWRAPSSGVATASASSTEYQPLGLVAYTGASLTTLVPVAKSPIESYWDYTDVAFKVTAGTTYHFAVEAPLNDTGDFGFRVYLGDPPPNDDIAQAATLGGSAGSTTVSTYAASREPGEPGIGVRTVWYRLRPAAGRMIFKLADFSFGDLALYRGSALGDLAEVPSMSDPVGKAFRVDGASEYRLVVFGKPWLPQDYQQDLGTLTWSVVEGDYADGPRALAGATGTATGSNAEATREAGEPAHSENFGGHSVWFSWTAPTAGTYAFSTAGSAFDTTLAIYRGTPIDGLETVASSDDTPTAMTSRAVFAAEPGATYLVALDGYSGARGDFALSWEPTNESPGSGDTTPPRSPLVSSAHPTEWSADRTVEVTWSGAADPESGVDGFSFAWSQSAGSDPGTTKDAEETATGTTSPELADGSWWFHLRTGDNAGNWSEATHLGPFRIDTTAPTNPILSASHAEHDWSNDNTVEATWSGAGDGSSGVDGFSYSWTQDAADDPGTSKLVEESGASTISEPLADGSWWFHLRTRDNAGNWSAPVHHGPFRIDTAAPTSPTLSSPTHTIGEWSNEPTVVVDWSGAQGQSYSHAWSETPSTLPDTVPEGTETRSVSTRPDGSWWFHVRARDAGGSWSGAAHIGPFLIDTAPPETAIDEGPSSQTTSTEATFAFSATEPGDFDCSLDGAAFAACQAPRSYLGLAMGDHVFAVRARDLAGNVDATPAERSWTIVPSTAPPPAPQPQPPAPTPPPISPPQPRTSQVVRCVVPRLASRSLRRARVLAVRAGCRIGRVRAVRSGRVARGRVISQAPKAGTLLRHGGRIRLTISLGRRPARP